MVSRNLVSDWKIVEAHKWRQSATDVKEVITYLISIGKGGKNIWLYSQKVAPGDYEQFCNGMRDYDIRNFDKWKRNPRLDKTIDEIPVYVAYVNQEIV